MNTLPVDADSVATSPPNLGLRLRRARQHAGLTLRALASQLGVSPSFLSQVENNKAQPSVATLYSLARVLEVSIDELFQEPPQVSNAGARAQGDPGSGSPTPGTVTGTVDAPVKRSDMAGIEAVWEPNTARVSLTEPGQRSRLVMETGVVWEQLALNNAHQVDFIEIVYPAGSSSTSDDRMLRHDGYEYGYLLEGELEITVGFDVLTMRAGDAIGINSVVPHLFRNRGSEPARGIWFVHHRHD